ncbi:MAG TPA: CoA-binding protein [Dehalococcoidia bacterium]|nr:CoA-binding protein [Dehalococcoidia bacterium]
MSAIDDMRLFMEPRSVAIIGVSRNTSDDGYVNTLEYLLEFGYPGQIYPINPSSDEILGVRAYPNVSQVPDPIDVAVISLPRHAVLPAVRECMEVGIRALIVVTQGFADADATGKALQEELARAARQGGARILGPNTMGVINAHSRFSSAFVSLVKPDRKLPVGFIGQSGFSTYLGLIARPLGLPWIGAKGIDVGNACDLDHSDALEYLAADPETRVVALHLEGVSNGRRFAQVAHRAARIKPILALKVGATEVGARAIASHTGSMVGEDQVYDAVLRQAGVIRVADVEELEDLAKAFATLPSIQGGRVAVLTPIGGVGVMAADACGRFGLDLAPFSPATVERLQPLFPDWMSAGNPVDVWPAAFSVPYHQVFHQIGEAVLADTNVDGVVCVVYSGAPGYDFFNPIEEVKDLAGRYHKPVVAYVYGPQCDEAAAAIEESGNVACYPSPVRAVRALGALWKYRRIAAMREGSVVRSVISGQ